MIVHHEITYELVANPDYDPMKAAEDKEKHEFDPERAAWNANPNRKMSFDQNLAKQGMATFGDDPSTIAEYEHYANWGNPMLEEKVDREYYTVGDDGTLHPNPVSASTGGAGSFSIPKKETSSGNLKSSNNNQKENSPMTLGESTGASVLTYLVSKIAGEFDYIWGIPLDLLEQFSTNGFKNPVDSIGRTLLHAGIGWEGATIGAAVGSLAGPGGTIIGGLVGGLVAAIVSGLVDYGIENERKKDNKPYVYPNNGNGEYNPYTDQ